MPAFSLQDLSDRAEIDDLVTRSVVALDDADWETFSSCFTPLARLDHSASGGIRGTINEVRAWLATVMESFLHSRHLATNREIVLDGDEASCRSSLLVEMGVADEEEDSLALFFEGSTYYDRLVRTPEGWRITERIEEPHYSTREHRVMIRPFEE